MRVRATRVKIVRAVHVYVRVTDGDYIGSGLRLTVKDDSVTPLRTCTRSSQ